MQALVEVDIPASEGAPHDQVAIAVVLDEPDFPGPRRADGRAAAGRGERRGGRVDALEGQ
jgi:hypothetical protein